MFLVTDRDMRHTQDSTEGETNRKLFVYIAYQYV